MAETTSFHDSPNYRRPPDDWRPKLAALVEKRGGAFQDLARELREGVGEG